MHRPSKSSLRPGSSDSLFSKKNVEKIRNFSSKFLRMKECFGSKREKTKRLFGAAATAGASAGIVGLRDGHKPDELDGAKLAGAAVGGTSGLLLLPEVGGAVPAGAPAFESDLPKHDKAGTVESLLTPEVRVAATAGESAGNISLHSVLESARSSLCHRSSLARSCADGDESCAVGVCICCLLLLVLLPCLCVVHSRMLVLLRMHGGEVARGYNSWSVGSRSVVQTVDIVASPCCWNISTVCRQSAMTSDRSLGNVGQRALGEVLVLVLVLAVGLVEVEESQASLRPSGRFLAHW